MRPSLRSPTTWLTIGAAALWASALLIYLAAPARELLIRVVPDDALFYLVIARNGASGAFSSFDGIERTNGYHPLWLLLLQPLALLLRAPDALVRAGLGLGLLAYAGAALALVRTLRPWGESARTTALGALALFVLPASWLLTEAPLALLLFALFLAQLLSEGAEPSDGGAGADRGRRLALWGALTVLARLDAVFLVVPPLALRGWDRLHAARASRWSAAAPLVVIGGVIAAYTTLNLVAFGHALPISGMIKGSFPTPALPRFGALSRFVRGLPPLAGALLWLGARAWGWRPPMARAADRSVTAMLLGLAGYYVYETFFQKDVAWGVASWHFALATLLLVTLLGLATARLPMRVAGATALALLVLAGIDLGRKLRPGSAPDTSLAPLAEAGAWLRDHAGPTDVVAATDPGLVAWLGERRTISLDGLVNTLAYQDVLRARGLSDYLEARGVDWVVVLGSYAAPPGAPLYVPIPSRLYAPAADSLDLGRADAAFIAAAGGVRIWRYPPGRPAR
jgi:hypothetical protein